MTLTYSLKKTPKQAEAIKLLNKHTVVNLAGGSRSGKTIIALYYIVRRALKYPGLMQIVMRFRFNHAKQSICNGSMVTLLKILGLSGVVKLNKSDYYYEFPNGSQIWIGGLDDSKRLEKILGNEYATIYLNEASQISYDGFEVMLTRLNPPQGVKGTMIVDYNPPTTSHWGYKLFVEHKYPDGSPVEPGMMAELRMNPVDNQANISETYLKTLSMLSVEKRKRFIDGEYGSDDGELWKRSSIKYNKDLPDFWRVVVGVDPSGSVDGDEVGIVVVGYAGDEFYVLDDYSMHGTPFEWSVEVRAAYRKWNADLIVAEKNFGGDMVEHVIRGSDRGLNVKLVTSSRGKIVRAEPISALYEQGKVYHRAPFLELEDEMCQYKPGLSSPNRMDALVFGLTELSSGNVSLLDVV